MLRRSKGLRPCLILTAFAALVLTMMTSPFPIGFGNPFYSSPDAHALTELGTEFSPAGFPFHAQDLEVCVACSGVEGLECSGRVFSRFWVPSGLVMNFACYFLLLSPIALRARTLLLLD